MTGINVLLVFIPISWAFHFARKDDDVLIFVFSFLAIIPLAKVHPIYVMPLLWFSQRMSASWLGNGRIGTAHKSDDSWSPECNVG
jgi:hypothetical protein